MFWSVHDVDSELRAAKDYNVLTGFNLVLVAAISSSSEVLRGE
jgi:hypothetical protein